MMSQKHADQEVSVAQEHIIRWQQYEQRACTENLEGITESEHKSSRTLSPQPHKDINRVSESMHKQLIHK